MNIEKVLFPESDILQKDGEVATSQIVDAELDPIKCDFKNDMCVELDVSDYQYISLTWENLETLKKLIGEADEYYKEYFKNETP